MFCGVNELPCELWNGCTGCAFISCWQLVFLVVGAVSSEHRTWLAKVLNDINETTKTLDFLDSNMKHLEVHQHRNFILGVL